MRRITFKSLIRSRTLQFAFLLAVFGAIDANIQVLQPLFGEKSFGIFCVVVSIIVAVLRVLTTNPIGGEK